MKITSKIQTSLVLLGSIAFVVGCGGVSALDPVTPSPSPGVITPTPIPGATPVPGATPAPGATPGPLATPTPVPLPTPTPIPLPTPTPIPSSTADQLRAVSQQVSVEGKILVATATVWIDRMPATVPTDLRVFASIAIVAADGSAVPIGLQMDRISVARAQDVWASTSVEPRRDANTIGGVIRQGPLWNDGDTVDIVADFTSSAGQHYQLRATTTAVTTVY